MISHGELTGVAVLVVIGAVLNRASVSEAAFAVRLTPVSINHIDGQSPYRRSGVPACPLIVCGPSHGQTGSNQSRHAHREI